MARLDHAKRTSRDLIARRGADWINDFGLPAGLSPPKPRMSKADLRAQLAEAEARITRAIQCTCGHKGTVIVPTSKSRARLRCGKCGEVQQ